jgi:hypothetical protein
MATHRRTWQKFEERAAAFFGSRRRVLSGSTNRQDIEGDDSVHPRLHIEAKLRAKHGVFRIWDEARASAAKLKDSLQRKGVPGHKEVVVCLQEKNREGFLVCVHSNDFEAAVIEWLVAQDENVLEDVKQAVRLRRFQQKWNSYNG